MNECIFAGIFTTAIVVVVLLMASGICTCMHMDTSNDDARKYAKHKKLNLWTWWLYHAHRMTEAKAGVPDPWEAWNAPLSKTEVFLINCFSVYWVIGPFAIIGLFLWVLWLLISTAIGLKILLTCVGIAGIVFSLFVISRFIMRTAFKAEESVDKLGRLVETVTEVDNASSVSERSDS
jgi:hypothetical protein